MNLLGRGVPSLMQLVSEPLSCQDDFVPGPGKCQQSPFGYENRRLYPYPYGIINMPVFESLADGCLHVGGNLVIAVE